MFTEFLSVLAISSTNIPVQKYQEIIANQPIYKIEKSKDKYVNISESLKTETNSSLYTLIKVYKKFIPLHKEVFINNFDNWELEEGDTILSLVKQTIDGNNKLNKQYIQLKKLVRGYPSLTSKIDELISLNNDMSEFTNQYLARAKEADEASKFINSFISNNQEVLKALA